MSPQASLQDLALKGRVVLIAGAAGGLGVMRYFSGENGFFAAEPASYALFGVPGVVTARGGRIGMRAWAKRLRAG